MQCPFGNVRKSIGNIRKSIHRCGIGGGAAKFCLPEGERRRFKAGGVAQERCGHDIYGKVKGDMMDIFSIFTIICMIVFQKEYWR